MYFDKPFNSLELMAYQNDEHAVLPCVITMPGSENAGGSGPNGMAGLGGGKRMSRGNSSPSLHSPSRLSKGGKEVR